MRFRWAVVLICLLVVASIYPLFNYVGMAFLPDEDESSFQISLRGPQGTSLSATQSILDRIARDVREQLPGVKKYLGSGRGFGGGGGGGIMLVRSTSVWFNRRTPANSGGFDQPNTRRLLNPINPKIIALMFRRNLPSEIVWD